MDEINVLPPFSANDFNAEFKKFKQQLEQIDNSVLLRLASEILPNSLRAVRSIPIEDFDDCK